MHLIGLLIVSTLKTNSLVKIQQFFINQIDPRCFFMLLEFFDGREEDLNPRRRR